MDYLFGAFLSGNGSVEVDEKGVQTNCRSSFCPCSVHSEHVRPWLHANPHMLLDVEMLKRGMKTGRQETSPMEILQLMKGLELAINSGRKDVATTIVRKLCELRTECHISYKNPAFKEIKKLETVIAVDLYVEDRGQHVGPLTLKVDPRLSFGQLKRKLEKDFLINSSIQRYIFGKKLVKDDAKTLIELGIHNGSPLILYLDYSEEMSPRSANAGPPMANQSSKEQQQFLGWICGFCGCPNVPTRPGCEFCTSPRPESYRIPAEYVPTESEMQRIRSEQEQDEAMKLYDEERQRRALANYQELLIVEDENVAPNNAEFNCAVCFNDILPGEGVTLRECLHVFCRECIVDHVRHSDEPVIPCPDQNCPYPIQEREIRALVPPDVFDKYLQRSIAVAETTTKNSFHCKTPDCPGWCVYEIGVNVRVFPCEVCRKQNCLTCQVIHEGMNCKEYQDKLELEAKHDEDKKRNLEELKKMLETKTAMRCPNCKVIIVKISGCSALHCTMCKRNITWAPGGTLD